MRSPTAPAVRELMKGLAGFQETGKRMLTAGSEGVSVLRDSRKYGLSVWKSSTAFGAISAPPKLKNPRPVIGRSELLSHRTNSKFKDRVQLAQRFALPPWPWTDDQIADFEKLGQPSRSHARTAAG